MTTRFLFLTILLALLSGCKPSSQGPLDSSGYENAVGAAALRQLIKDTQVAYPNQGSVPFAIVIGERLASPSPIFLTQFDTLGLEFVDHKDLDFDRVTKATVLKGTRTSPIVLQLTKITQLDPQTHEVEAAWNRNRDVVRKVYQAKGDPDGGNLTITELRVIRDERFPDTSE
ncbi:MAG: hypothetical protein ACI8T1_004203 [Verrucomicrobiales bacterium]|jgi:hypothetical protein